MSEEALGLFGKSDQPDHDSAWKLYEKGQEFNQSIRLDDTVKANENFYIGKQWEGIEAKGLPTTQVNYLKRVVGFTTATVTTDNITVNASPLAAAPNPDSLIEPVRIVNDEFVALAERNRVPSMLRVFTRDAAVDGDGCTYTYWDSSAKNRYGRKGEIRTEIIENTRVFFGNPNDRQVQTQPFIQIVSREITRRVKKKARQNGVDNWERIQSDTDATMQTDAAKLTDDKTTVILTLWKDEDSGEVWAYESCKDCTVREPWNLGIHLYPVTWLNWDNVKDCYHGQAMITGLLPNQISVNKMWAMSVLHGIKETFPKIVYNKTLVSKWDNRVGSAIGIAGGDINNVAKVIEGAPLNPMISNLITQLVKETEESMGATGTAMGEGRADNTSAIIALQRAAATPTELTKQNLYETVEDLFRIYLEFMGEYYGKRMVDMEPPEEMMQNAAALGIQLPEKIQMEFDFSTLKEHPMTIKLDVGASSYYSEIASIQTLDNLLRDGHIDAIQYLERIPDGYIPARRALLTELKGRQAAMQAQQMMPGGAGPGATTGGSPMDGIGQPEIHGGSGYGALQRAINATGETRGMV